LYKKEEDGNRVFRNDEWAELKDEVKIKENEDRYTQYPPYKIITLANHSETKEPLVIYQSISFGSTYARPLSMWEEVIENKRGGIEPRFKKIEDNE